MKHRASVFLIALLASLLIVPAVNISRVRNFEAIQWEKSFFYNMDFASSFAAKWLYPLGISINSRSVVIGRDGWLFLGDAFESTLSAARHSPAAGDVQLAKQIGVAAAAWDTYFASKGVQLFRVMIGPNKGSIYPEHLPRWAQPISPNATDALISETGNVLYVDLRSPLLKAKAHQEADFYYKLDTHWNSLGSAMGFRAFAQHVGPVAPELQWPPSEAYALKSSEETRGGDLANFLRLPTQLSDIRLAIRASDFPLQSTRIDFDTQKLLHTGGHLTTIPPTKPVLVRTANALNNKKVLWLRDSFGDSMSLMMEATFSDVVQLHWHEAIKPGGRLVQLVDNWKPDYVFFTVVERDARNGWFTVPPPVASLNQAAPKDAQSR
jgi:alginate O-acetyltransferase complex protein AlgJ